MKNLIEVMRYSRMVTDIAEKSATYWSEIHPRKSRVPESKRTREVLVPVL
jgi:hypothetical protein